MRKEDRRQVRGPTHSFVFLCVPFAALCVFAVGPLPCPAQDAPKAKLRWGADKAGGNPYIYEFVEHGKTELRGFEVDLAEHLGKELVREPVNVSADWNKLPDLLNTGDLDIVLNGYEFSPKLHALYPTTIPYYIYKLQLLGRPDDKSLTGWADLAPKIGPHKTVVTLEGSAAARYCDEQLGGGSWAFQTVDVAAGLEKVMAGEYDASIQDNPTAGYFARDKPDKLRILDEARAPGYYVILTRPGDDELREQLNAALRKAIDDGTLEKIYRKYHVWNADQERLSYWAKPSTVWPPPSAGEDDAPAEQTETDWLTLTWRLVQAAGMTVFLACASMPLAMLLGLLVALGRLYGPAWLRGLLLAYVEVVRGTPLLLQLYFIYFLFPDLLRAVLPEDWRWLATLNPVVAGIAGLAINYSAYEAENYRAGLLAVPRGQMEAALALGMTPSAALRRVVVPQAAKIVIPPVTNDFIALFKDTSVCSVIMITELTRQYNQLYNFNRDLIVQLAFLTAGLYLLMSYPLAVLARRLEQKRHQH